MVDDRRELADDVRDVALVPGCVPKWTTSGPLVRHPLVAVDRHAADLAAPEHAAGAGMVVYRFPSGLVVVRAVDRQHLLRGPCQRLRLAEGRIGMSRKGFFQSLVLATILATGFAAVFYVADMWVLSGYREDALGDRKS